MLLELSFEVPERDVELGSDAPCRAVGLRRIASDDLEGKLVRGRSLGEPDLALGVGKQFTNHDSSHALERSGVEARPRMLVREQGEAESGDAGDQG